MPKDMPLVESLSAYARQFLSHRFDADQIDGIAPGWPSVKNRARNPRSTAPLQPPKSTTTFGYCSRA
jgi:excinuclease UvrABC ATPase subunit